LEDSGTLPHEKYTFNEEIADLLEKNKEAKDPLCLLQPIQGKPMTDALHFVAGLLMEAVKITRYSFRRFYDSDGQNPVVTYRFQLEPLPPSLTKLFNDIGLNIPSAEMCRNLSHWERYTTPHWLEKLGSRDLKHLFSDQKDMLFELLRIVEKIYERFPQLQQAEPSTSLAH
jgi:hypothetical protein